MLQRTKLSVAGLNLAESKYVFDEQSSDALSAVFFK